MSPHRDILRRWTGSQASLAKLLGVDVSTLWRWRNGSFAPTNPGTLRLMEWLLNLKQDEWSELQGHAKRHEWADAIELIARTGGRR